MLRSPSQLLCLFAALSVGCSSPAVTERGSPPIQEPRELTVEEIVSRSAEAMGGSGNLAVLTALKFEYLQPGQRLPVEWEILRPNRVRKELGQEFVLVFDGDQAAFLHKTESDGSIADPHLIPAQDWHHFELDIALFIPAYLDFSAESLGTASVNGSEAYLLQVTLPMGGVVKYAIDKTSYLPLRVDIPDWGLRRRLGDYRSIAGILYPHLFWNAANPDQRTTLNNLSVNAELGPDRFWIPEDLR